jgi:hypothetical protein
VILTIDFAPSTLSYGMFSQPHYLLCRNYLNHKDVANIVITENGPYEVAVVCRAKQHCVKVLPCKIIKHGTAC